LVEKITSRAVGWLSHTKLKKEPKMSTRTTTKTVVRNWASVPTINTLAELCVIWASGNPGQPCDPALPVLIGDLKQAFPTKNLEGLRPSDMKGSGSIKTTEALISFIASSPSNDSPFALVSAEALAQLHSIKGTGKKPASKSEKASSTKKAKKAGKKGAAK
jgi:hypothetical protein